MRQLEASAARPSNGHPLYSRFFSFPLFVSFHPPPPPPPSPRPGSFLASAGTYKLGRAHKLSPLRACHALLNSALPANRRQRMSVNGTGSPVSALPAISTPCRSRFKRTRTGERTDANPIRDSSKMERWRAREEGEGGGRRRRTGAILLLVECAAPRY